MRQRLYSNYLKAIVCIVILSAIYGFYGVITRSLNDQHFSVMQQLYLRLLVSVAVAFIVFRHAINFKSFRHLPRREWILLGVRGLGAYLIGGVLFTQALIHTDLGSASLIATLPLVPIAGFIFFKEKMDVQKLSLTLAAFAGAFLVATTDLDHPFSWQAGDMFALASVIGYTIAYIGRKMHGKQVNNKEMTAFMLLFGCLGVITASLLAGEGLPVHANWTLPTIGILLFAGTINVVNLLLTNYAFGILSNVLAGNLMMLQIVFGIACGLVVYGETFDMRQIAGAFIIVASVILLNIVEARSKNMAEITQAA